MPKNLFSDEDVVKLSSKFKVLSEQSRLQILRCLHLKDKCVQEIVDETGFLQANVSKQLKMLVDNKIVEYRSNGHQHIYHIIDNDIISICKLICKK